MVFIKGVTYNKFTIFHEWNSPVVYVGILEIGISFFKELRVLYQDTVFNFINPTYSLREWMLLQNSVSRWLNQIVHAIISIIVINFPSLFPLLEGHSSLIFPPVFTHLLRHNSHTIFSIKSSLYPWILNIGAYFQSTRRQQRRQDCPYNFRTLKT